MSDAVLCSLLVQYLETTGMELSDDDTRALYVHVQSCARCQERLLEEGPEFVQIAFSHCPVPSLVFGMIKKNREERLRKAADRAAVLRDDIEEPRTPLCAELRKYFRDQSADLSDERAQVLFAHLDECAACKNLCIVVADHKAGLLRFDRIPRLTFLALKRMDYYARAKNPRLLEQSDLYDALKIAQDLASWRGGDRSILPTLYRTGVQGPLLVLPDMFGDWEVAGELWPEIAARTLVTVRDHPMITDLQRWTLLQMYAVVREYLAKRGEDSAHVQSYIHRIVCHLIPFELRMMIHLHFVSGEAYAQIAPLIHYRMTATSAEERVLRGLATIRDAIFALGRMDPAIASLSLPVWKTVDETDPCERFTRICGLSEDVLPNDFVEGWSTHAAMCAACAEQKQNVETALVGIWTAAAHRRPGRRPERAWYQAMTKRVLDAVEKRL
ncbi:hypothetical protein HY629_00435 [Candidatus Uhrbacteria bacterium]|nr:hypothetical protein [Candidatus Uhrbacteria bacterium]